MASSSVEQPTLKAHPFFSSPQADVILTSNEGTYYRVYSFTLRNTSNFFRSIIAPPTPLEKNSPTKLETHISVDEKDVVLERVLRMLCGLETPKWENFDQLEEAVSLIERWEALGPLSIIRSAITAPLFLEQPLRLYVMATHFGWEEEAKLASTYTLSLSLYDEEHRSQLEHLSSKDLMTLLAFHRKRRDLFKHIIDTDEAFSAGNVANRYCSGCGEETDNHAWRELKAKLFSEMDRRPLGDTLSGLEMEEWSEATACWNSKCSKEGCRRLNYDKLVTLRHIQEFVAQLPSTI